MVIPATIGATGMVTKGVKKKLEATPGIHSVDPQQTAIRGTSHIIRKVLQCETLSLSDGDYCWFKGSTKKEGLVIRYDDDDNNNNNNNDNALHISSMHLAQQNKILTSHHYRTACRILTPVTCSGPINSLEVF